MYQAILWEVQDHTGVLRLNRPERLNAVDNVMRQELEDVMRKAEADPQVWTIIVTGNGRGFCSGADLSELTKPVIAAVNGVTRGAGCNMVWAADFRIASEQANFGVNFVERGLMGETSAYYLPRLVGHAVAAEICLLGEPFDAARAKAWGLLNAVVPHEKLMEEALALARRLNGKAPIAVRMTKMALRRAYAYDAEQFLDLQNAMNNKLRTTADTKEAMGAFLEKRSPVFRGE
jgi:2-(1,2-epoxy-1,2-dihydrophenyl)acetyl-CoA isomerase